MTDDLETRGFAIVPGVLPRRECEELAKKLKPVAGAGRRDLLSDPSIAQLARHPSLLAPMYSHLLGAPRPVRGIYFDKSPEANWLVSWHQDLTLAVRSRVDVEDFGPWSMKDGVPHVQPPPALLTQMLTVRLHLDDADDANGALRVLPGTHRYGRLSAKEIARWRAQISEVICVASAGDALLMRPLLLHSSGRSRTARHRRVLHIEYASFDLPTGLEWHETV